MIRRWFRQDPGANIGVSCRASNLLGLDADERHGGVDAVGDLERELGDLPDTPRVLTPDGFRVVLQHPGADRLVSKVTTDSGEVEVLDRKYMLMPPSVHPCGLRCAWFRHPDDAPAADLADLWITRLLVSEMSSTTCGDLPFTTLDV